MKVNAGLKWGGLGLETSTSAATLDVTYSLIVDQSLQTDPIRLLSAMQQVANFADSIEERMGGGTDHF
jgi:hypothetical protein